jgi:hypothetical protein
MARTYKHKKPNRRSRRFRHRGGVSTPTLSRIRTDISEYDYKYLEDTLRKIGLGDTHRAFTDDTQTDTFFFYELPEIMTLMQTEIANITRTYGSGKYHFSIESTPKIINELNQYIQYFTEKADEFGRVNMEFQEALFA